MIRLLFALFACSALAACTNHEEEPSDFGAAHIARMVVAAEKKCAVAHYASIADCAESETLKTEAGVASRRAQDTYAIFQSGCYESLGMSKCEALIEKAYAEAKKR